jgi:folate-binding protein YgfZ
MSTWIAEQLKLCRVCLQQAPPCQLPCANSPVTFAIVCLLQAAPLDYNMDELLGVSYRKGCYIGQERNSFTHFRGIIRRRCMPLRVMRLPQGGAKGTWARLAQGSSKLHSLITKINIA